MGVLQKYNQKEFVDDSIEESGFGPYGYVYIPTQCADGTAKCKVHVNLHGCIASASNIGEVGAENLGFNEYAVGNDMIIVYPQANGLMRKKGDWLQCWSQYEKAIDDPNFDK